jgi:hypothetical protein
MGRLSPTRLRTSWNISVCLLVIKEQPVPNRRLQLSAAGADDELPGLKCRRYRSVIQQFASPE